MRCTGWKPHKLERGVGDCMIEGLGFLLNSVGVTLITPMSAGCTPTGAVMKCFFKVCMHRFL